MNLHFSSNDSFLKSKWLPFAISGFFLVTLALWFCLDHSLPIHDAAWHSIYSSKVRQWLCHPRSWNFDGFRALLMLHGGYPSGVWFINGTVKTIIGDTKFSDPIILLLYAAALNLTFWLLSLKVWKDRLKALLGLLVLNCFPLFAMLERLPFLDLPHAVLFTLFLYTLLCWREKPTWKSALICGLAFGLDCISKQTAVLYAGPCLFLAGLSSIRLRKLDQFMQFVLIGCLGVSFFSSWILPNLAMLTKYGHERTAYSAHIKVSDAVWKNFCLSVWQIGQSISPLGLLGLILCLPGLKGKDFSAGIYALVGAVSGWLLILTAAYYNTPEPRYFTPVLVVIALFMGCGLGNLWVLKRRWLQAVIVCLLVLMPIQLTVLSFCPAPVITSPTVQGVNELYKLCGISESLIVSRLPLARQKDPWRQRWLIDTILANEELERPCLVNVIPNTLEYNQGTLTYLASQLKKPVLFTTWRGCMGNMTDKLEFSEANLRFADWHLLKTGYQGGRFTDLESKLNYKKTLDLLQQPNKFKFVAKTSLPDGSELLLYHTNHLYQSGWTSGK